MTEQDDKIFRRFLEFIKAKNLIDPGEKILLAVSGGMDSMVMATLFKKSGFNFGIAHCNFSMRGDESDGDEELVRKFTGEISTAIHLQKFDTNAYATENKLTIQEAARKLRYKWFEEICVENGYHKIATAHHHNDSIETFFINLLRGSGPAGLRGIPVINKNIIRPLLFATRDEISRYAKSEKVPYRTDSSNETDDYLRNRIRHHFIPVLSSLEPDFEKKFALAFDNISFMHEFSMRTIEAWKKSNVVINENGEISIPIDAIKAEPDAVQFLSFLLYSFGITDFDARQILGNSEPGRIFLSKKHELLRDRSSLILREIQIREQPVSVSEIPARVHIGKKHIQLTFTPSENFAGKQGDIQQVDSGKISLPITIRPWQQGDYFYPLGMNGKKKVSDFFVDRKMSLFEKESTYLLLSGNDIVCILGHRIDDRYKVTPETKNILTIEFT